MTTAQYQVSGLHCDACVNRVQNTLEAHAETVQVTLTPPMATLENSKSDLNKLNIALSNIGDYQLSPTTRQLDSPLHPKEKEGWLANPLPIFILLTCIFLISMLVSTFL